MKELKIITILTINSFQQVLFNRFLLLIFTVAKILRILMFFVFLGFIFEGSQSLGDFSKNQIIFFYLTFNLVDLASQLLFREVYRFRQLVVSGSLDFILVKPINPLLRVLIGGMDFIDLLLLVLVAIFLTYFGFSNISQDLLKWLLYLMLIINSLIISASLHIFVLGLGIITTSVDHFIMVYRDLASMLRIPADLYIEPIRIILTYMIPLAIMITFPASALMGLLSAQFIILSFLLSTSTFYLALLFWKFSLKKYQGASA